jgi:hypothetical protein
MKYEYRLRADLPPDASQPSSLYATFEEVATVRDSARHLVETLPGQTARANPRLMRRYEALADGWIECRPIGDWERVDE